MNEFDVLSNEIRTCLTQLGVSQRAAAKRLQVPERDFRAYCAGHPCPRVILFALHYWLILDQCVNGEKP